MGFLIILMLIGVPAGIGLLIHRQHNKDLEDWNKENKKKFETYYELKIHLKALEDKERSEVSRLRDYRRNLGKREQWNKEEEARRVKERARFRKELEDKIKEEDKIKRAPKKESFEKTTFSGGGLTGKIARLQKLYKNGTLTKAEFEKAKNNLLK